MYFYGLRGRQTQGPPRAAHTLATPLNVHHKGSKNFYLKPDTTKESLELTIVWSLATRSCWQ